VDAGKWISCEYEMSNGITLLIIGNEILDGLREDNNFRAALKYLKDVTKIKYVLFVRDDLDDIRKALLLQMKILLL